MLLVSTPRTLSATRWEPGLSRYYLDVSKICLALRLSGSTANTQSLRWRLLAGYKKSRDVKVKKYTNVCACIGMPFTQVRLCTKHKYIEIYIHTLILLTLAHTRAQLVLLLVFRFSA